MRKQATKEQSREFALRDIQSKAQRWTHCAGVLAIDGLLTDAERARVHQRILKLKARLESKVQGD